MSTCRISTLPAELQQAFRDCLASVGAGSVGAPLLELVGTLRKYFDHELDSKDLLHQFAIFILLLKNGLPDHTPDWAAKVMRMSNLPADLKCTFCGKPEKEVSKLVSGPAVLICDGCIELCTDIIRPGAAKA